MAKAKPFKRGVRRKTNVELSAGSGLTVGSPTFDTPELKQHYNLSAVPLEIASPTLPRPRMRQGDRPQGRRLEVARKVLWPDDLPSKQAMSDASMARKIEDLFDDKKWERPG